MGLAYRLIACGQGIVYPDVKDDEKGDERREKNKGEFLPDAHLHLSYGSSCIVTRGGRWTMKRGYRSQTGTCRRETWI